MILTYYYKKMIASIFGCLAILVLLTSPVSAYEPTDADFIVLDKVEDRIFDRIETSPTLTAQKIIAAVEEIIERKKGNERLTTLLEILIEDIHYFTGVDDSESDYESEIDYTVTAEECYDDEYYDEATQWCYPKEDSTTGLDENQDWDHSHDHSFHEKEEGKPDNELEASYEIKPGDTLKLTSGKTHVQHTEVWNLFTSLIVPSYRQDLLKINFFRDPSNETFAYVEQIRDNEKYWQMAINLALFYKDGQMDQKESIHTLIHEYTHVLTLNKEQVTYTPLKVVDIIKYEKACTTTYVQEGCLKKNSYLEAFITAFWTDKEREKANNGENVTYSENTFVSEYASSNPGEDIAESFTTFVLQSKPSGKNIREKKMLFFYNYPELVKIRDLIRSRLPR